MRAGVSREEFAGDGPAGQQRHSRSRSMADVAGRGIKVSPVRIAGGRRESGQLRDALRLRTAPGVSSRCLDRTRFAATIFPAETKGHGATTPRILRSEEHTSELQSRFG